MREGFLKRLLSLRGPGHLSLATLVDDKVRASAVSKHNYSVVCFSSIRMKGHKPQALADYAGMALAIRAAPRGGAF
ncbi:hypothetical protein M8828_17605 [Aeromonas simiae]|uniref:hypothetical protein n=1 Tax=Aeromonas simiae TaxID=218936 RepID=UPI00266BBC32|nr:hypothetical protein [Aeromonas simiae]MDO2950186.1 hypothetical protein [Aeromonas simiae]MDO2957594.1 hypothetical protein [Aeromonas simiae]